ncbi:hypothetical protein ACTXG5_22855 [Mycobacterium sp. Dal123C01]|uniref:hypothetical protein n=1 Tax=Mycobacterium sp. Dal123C01 TaxID=3457577 RepID=UPI00403E7428
MSASGGSTGDRFTFDDLRSEPVPIERLEAFGPEWQARRRAALAERAAVLAAHVARERSEAVARNLAESKVRVAARHASKAPAAVVVTGADEREVTVPLGETGLELSLSLPTEGELVYYVRCAGDAAVAVTFVPDRERWLVWTWRRGEWVRIGGVVVSVNGS